MVRSLEHRLRESPVSSGNCNVRHLLFTSFLPCLIVLSIHPSSAQITITASHVSATLAPNMTTTSHTDTTTHSADIGQMGSTSWDFSTLHSDFVASLTAVVPDTTPFFQYFPGSTHAQRFGTGAPGTFYVYYALGQDLLTPGSGQSGSPEIRRFSIPDAVTYQLPMTFGTSWTSDYVDSTVIVLSPPLMTITSQAVSNTVDAYGSLVLPGGIVEQAIRLKTDRRSSTNGFSSRTLFYNFLTESGSFVGVLARDTLQATTGTIDVASISWSVAGPTDVQSSDVLPDGFALRQNYPNPFNPSTIIEFDLSRSSFVTLAVYDVLGRTVATLLSETMEAGDHTVTWDATGQPGGVYFYRLTAGAFVQTRKLVLLR